MGSIVGACAEGIEVKPSLHSSAQAHSALVVVATANSKLCSKSHNASAADTVAADLCDGGGLESSCCLGHRAALVLNQHLLHPIEKGLSGLPSRHPAWAGSKPGRKLLRPISCYMLAN